MYVTPLAQVDAYKVSHHNMYPKSTTKIYSNLTPRKSRMPGVDKVVVFGLQYFMIDYLQNQWSKNFFGKPKEEVVAKYVRLTNSVLGPGSVTTEHIEKLHDLQYLPLEIKALPEGSRCPIGVPVCTITNTVDHAYWLVNYLETILSCTVWGPMTSATIADHYYQILSKYAWETTGSKDFVQFQGHDFSMRGMFGLEAAVLSGMGHLTSFKGSDTIPAIEAAEKYYGANLETELVGASVPATEHSVMCMGTKGDELGTFRRLLQQYPTGILSVVSDTWDLWKVCTEYLPALKEEILARNGKLVIRPDSGDPVRILCGYTVVTKLDREYIEDHPVAYDELVFEEEGKFYRLEKKWYGWWDDSPEYVKGKEVSAAAVKGVIQLLYDVFGGTVNEIGFIELDSHIGAIYGDSITPSRAGNICLDLKNRGFASTNAVLGIGSFTYQYNTRDTFGFAVKATYGEVIDWSKSELEAHGPGVSQWYIEKEAREIFKDPITDDGTKRSAKGLLRVNEVLAPDSYGKVHHRTYELEDQCTPEREKGGALETVFLDGVIVKRYTLEEIRKRLRDVTT